MRLILIPIIILILLFLFIIILPVLFLQITEPVLDSNVRIDLGEKLSFLEEITGRYQSSIDVLNYLISLKPGNPVYYWKKAECYEKLGKIKDSINEINNALRLTPDNNEYLLKKARLTLVLGDGDESTRTYDIIDKSKPNNYNNLIYAGDAALDRNNYLLAYDRYKKAVEINPDNGLYQEKLGDVIFALLTIPTAGIEADKNLKNTDLYSEGIECYKNAIRLQPERSNLVGLKIQKRASEYIPRTINDLLSRYNEYKYIK